MGFFRDGARMRHLGRFNGPWARKVESGKRHLINSEREGSIKRIEKDVSHSHQTLVLRGLFKSKY